jgi:hypothetical protein
LEEVGFMTRAAVKRVFEVDGPLAPLIRRAFAREVDRAITKLQEWFRR